VVQDQAHDGQTAALFSGTDVTDHLSELPHGHFITCAWISLAGA
jgi:hypothetical protein